ncbi:MAG TPA: archease [Streptosporangiales bacterium]
MSAGGHRALPHTADLRIEAWAPTREACIGEAVAGLAEAFVSVPDGVPVSRVRAELAADTGEDALVAVLDEAIYLTDTSDAVAVRADLTATAGGVRVTFDTVPLDRVELVGAVPKAVTLHRLRLTEDAGGWTCSVVVDV